MVDIQDPGEVKYYYFLLSNIPAEFSDHMILGWEEEAGGEGDGGQAVAVEDVEDRGGVGVDQHDDMEETAGNQPDFHADQQPQDEGEAVGQEVHPPPSPQSEGEAVLDSEEHGEDDDGREGGGGYEGEEGTEEGAGENDDGPGDDAPQGSPHA